MISALNGNKEEKERPTAEDIARAKKVARFCVLFWGVIGIFALVNSFVAWNPMHYFTELAPVQKDVQIIGSLVVFIFSSWQLRVEGKRVLRLSTFDLVQEFQEGAAKTSVTASSRLMDFIEDHQDGVFFTIVAIIVIVVGSFGYRETLNIEQT